MKSAPISELPRLHLKNGQPAECCIRCKHWFHGAAAEPPVLPGQPTPGLLAPCRRYPPSVLMMHFPVGGNPRVIDPRTGAPQHSTLQQQPVPISPVTQALQWCGEFTPQPAAADQPYPEAE